MDEGALQSSATRLGLMTRLLQGLDDQCRLGERGSDGEFLQVVPPPPLRLAQGSIRPIARLVDAASRPCYTRLMRGGDARTAA